MTNLFFMSVAYKAVALQLMLGEANFFSQRLHLPTPHPIEVKDLNQSFVRPPGSGFGGRIGTTNFDFCFYKEGKLWQIVNKVEQVGNFERYPEWKKAPLLIDDKGAYQLATQWLAAVSVDVPALEKQFKARVTQPIYYNPENGRREEKLPVYEVNWGGDESSSVGVTILATTKELMLLTLNDLSFSKRPPLIIPNAEELNRQPDPVEKKLHPKTIPRTNHTAESIRLHAPDP